MVLTLADMDGNETFDASALGTAEEVLRSLQTSAACPVQQISSVLPG